MPKLYLIDLTGQKAALAARLVAAVTYARIPFTLGYVPGSLLCFIVTDAYLAALRWVIIRTLRLR